MIDEGFEKQDLDPWEAELEFTPVWIGIEEALRINQANIGKPDYKKSDWITRETYVLSELAKSIPGGRDGRAF